MLLVYSCSGSKDIWLHDGGPENKGLSGPIVTFALHGFHEVSRAEGPNRTGDGVLTVSHSADASEPHAHPQKTLAHRGRSEEHTSELQSRLHLVCRLLLEKKKKQIPPSSPCAS